MSTPRRALTAGALALAAVAGVMPARAATNVPPPFSMPLTFPPVITDANVTLRAQVAQVQILPDGPPTTMWTYNGTFPGPTIRRPSGERTTVRLVNELPPEVGGITMHRHGGHNASSEDGQPHGEFLIQPGAERTYTFDLMEDGAPERAAMEWYHDHAMDVTGRNVWMGLAGMMILDDAFEASLPLPKGEFELPLTVVDRTFNEDNQIPYEFNIGGVSGKTLLVNGVPQPYHVVGDRKYRVRILNASNDRSYLLALSNGMPMTQIGTESGLLPEPVVRTEIPLGPAERADVVIDFADLLGERVELRNLYGFGTTAQVMEFRVEHDLVDDSSIPSALRPLPDIDWAAPDRARTWVLGQTEVPQTTWTINGRGYEGHHVDTAPFHPVIETTEKWVFVNATTVPHVMHIHDVDWLITGRTLPLDDGTADPSPGEAGLKETFVVRPFETVEVVSRFTDHLGTYVFHCHILEHEDRAMMAQFEVVAPY